MRSEKRSSAEARKSPSTTTVVVFTFVFSVAFGLETAATEEVEATAGGAGVALPGVGVPVRLGSALMVKSLPCVSMIAEGNAANLASKAVGRRVRARVNKVLTSGEESVERVQLNYSKQLLSEKAALNRHSKPQQHRGTRNTYDKL